MESNIWRERVLGFVGGSLILVFCTFVYGQVEFQRAQRVFTIGFVDGSWSDVPATANKKR